MPGSRRVEHDTSAGEAVETIAGAGPPLGSAPDDEGEAFIYAEVDDDVGRGVPD
jgi:hypothetical protein